MLGLIGRPDAVYAQLVPAQTANPIEIAEPVFTHVPDADHARAAQCLALAIGYEAANEPLAGQQAVAEVVLNRVRHAGYPKTVCGVVFQGSERRTGCQFSFTCDGSMRRHAFAADRMASWQAIAEAALEGLAPSRVPGATHYHANYVSPRWAPSLVRVAQLGLHIFYRQAEGSDPTLSTGYVGGTMPEAFGTLRTSAARGAPRTSGYTKNVAPAVFAPWGLMPASR